MKMKIKLIEQNGENIKELRFNIDNLQYNEAQSVAQTIISSWKNGNCFEEMPGIHYPEIPGGDSNILYPTDLPEPWDNFPVNSSRIEKLESSLPFGTNEDLELAKNIGNLPNAEIEYDATGETNVKDLTEAQIKTSNVHELRRIIARTPWLLVPKYSKLGAKELRKKMIEELEKYNQVRGLNKA